MTENEKQLWRGCEHKWVRDPDASFDDHIKHYCKTCKLWRNRHLYC